MDKNCKNCEILKKVYGEQCDWFETLSVQNMKLLEKSSKQNNELYLLKSKLQAKNIATASKNLEAAAEYGFYSTDLNKPIDVLLKESMAALDEADAFKEGINHLIGLFDENISYLTGMLEFFRGSYFKQLQITNDLKRELSDKMIKNSTNEHKMMINQLKEEEEKIRQTYKQRYQEVIKNLQEQLRKRTKVNEALKERNSELHALLRQVKATKIDEIAETNGIIANRNMLLEQYRKNNEKLKKQMKLQAEGHHVEMENMRKKLAELIMDKTKEK